jgi:hypothetical protein
VQGCVGDGETTGEVGKTFEETFNEGKDLAAFGALLASSFARARKLGDSAAECHGEFVLFLMEDVPLSEDACKIHDGRRNEMFDDGLEHF